MANRKFIKFKIALGLALASFILICPINSFGYSTLTTHRLLADESAKVFNHYYPNLTLAPDQINLLIKGDVDEDTPPRWLNHFYDPVHQSGFRGLMSSKNWAESAINDYSWEQAIYEYVYGDKNRGLEALGHTLHLIQDATVPDHTRDDAHPIWSTYEHYAKQFDLADADLAGKLISEKQAPIILANLGAYFDYLANFSNNNFFSDDTILESDYPGPKIVGEQEIILSDQKPHIFGQNNLKQNNKLVEIKKIKSKITGQINTTYTINDDFNLIPSDYWTNLSPKATLAGVGVIKLFFDEVEKERQTKRLFEKNKSLIEKLLTNLTGKVDNLLAGALFAGARSTVTTATTSPLAGDNLATTSALIATTAEPEVMISTDDSDQAKIDELYQKLQKLKSELNQIIANRDRQTAESLRASTTRALALISGGNGGILLPAVSEIIDSATSSTSSDTVIIAPPVIISPADFSQSFATTSLIFSGTASSGLVVFNDFNKIQATTSEAGEWTTEIANLPYGSSTIKFYARDNLGHVSLSAEVVLIVIKPLPVIPPGSLVINEIGWAGTTNSNLDEWLELKNYLYDQTIDLTDYYLTDIDKTWQVDLSGKILPKGYYLIERGSDTVISNRSANLVTDFIADTNIKVFNPIRFGLKLWRKNSAGDDLVDETPAWTKLFEKPSSLERTWEGRISTDYATWLNNPGCNETDGPCALDRNATTTFGTPGVINWASIPRPM